MLSVSVKFSSDAGKELIPSDSEIKSEPECGMPFWRDADPATPGAQQPQIGGQQVSYAAIDAGNWRHFASHCDLITRIEGRRAIAIGGNVGNRVAETPYNLDNDGRVSHAHGVAIVKNYK
jgi:hypothetical protein